MRNNLGVEGVFAAVTDPLLLEALVGVIGRIAGNAAVGVTDWDTLRRGHVVVTSSNDCSTALCADLSGRGVQVIVLATIPSAVQHEAYRRAGSAAYLPMELNHEPLRVAILEARSAGRALCHGGSNPMTGSGR